MQQLDHFFDSQLTQTKARAALEEKKIVAALYTNRENTCSVVHSHPYHELILPVSGSDVVYAINGTLYTVRPGELIYIPSECFHAGRYNVTASVSERLVVQIDDYIWRTARNKAENSQEWMLDIAVLSEGVVAAWDLRGLLERMAQNGSLAQPYRNAAFIAQTAELQLLITQILSEQKQDVSCSSNSLASWTAAYLQQHYQDADLSISRLAKEAFTSREHLSRVFREYAMESTHSYLTNLRMQHCRRALAAGSSVLDACNESGFTNYSSFLKSFRKLYGMTPAEYRAVCRHGT